VLIDEIHGKLAKVRLTGQRLPFKIIVRGTNTLSGAFKILEKSCLLIMLYFYVMDDGVMELVIHEEACLAGPRIAGCTDCP
jgi:hypothetical protein